MTVPAAIWYLSSVVELSDRNQFDTSTGADDRLRSSIHPPPGAAGLARISLTTTVFAGSPTTSAPGSPLTFVLARHDAWSPQVDAAAFGSTITSVNPSPAGCENHLSEYEKSRISWPTGPSRRMRSPSSDRVFRPANAPATIPSNAWP